MVVDTFFKLFTAQITVKFYY